MLSLPLTSLDEEPPDIKSAAHFPISTEFASLLKRALWKREDRYGSAREMPEAVKAYIDDTCRDQHRDQMPSRWKQGSAQSEQAVRVVLDVLQGGAVSFQRLVRPRIPAGHSAGRADPEPGPVGPTGPSSLAGGTRMLLSPLV